MAATVKPIEAKSVHQIQSGQVIVDLCSVVKELVENSLDAGANTVEVRFKNNGLDEIEVQDNGSGIAAVNYDSVALKHHTSKLSTYDDLAALQTFGFRGEALSSLCALSTFTITTAQSDEAPKGHRLEFEISGKLKDTSIVACQKGTTASVQNLFEKLPVRRKELSKNIKREYGKVLGLLHAYACISTNVKFTVKNAMSKGKSLTVFATKSNATTRDNITNVYGAKTLSALVALSLDFHFPQSTTQATTDDSDLTRVVVQGHISKPVFGEGRQTPDRQMFFVNGRPCGLPQIAKAINEVYRSFNVSQSPFILADFQMDTGAYDVNVSPDKRTIFLHNASALIEKMKGSLTELFEGQDQTVPQSQLRSSRLPPFKSLSVQREPSSASTTSAVTDESGDPTQSDVELDLRTGRSPSQEDIHANRLLHDHFRDSTSTREPANIARATTNKQKEQRALNIARNIEERGAAANGFDKNDDVQAIRNSAEHQATYDQVSDEEHIHVRDFRAGMVRLQKRQQLAEEDAETGPIPIDEASIAALKSMPQSDSPGVVPSAFDRMRPKRLHPEVATITIGDKTITRPIGSQAPDVQRKDRSRVGLSANDRPAPRVSGGFGQGLQRFSAPGTPSFDAHGLERVEFAEDLGLLTPFERCYPSQFEPAGVVDSNNQPFHGGSVSETPSRVQTRSSQVEDADEAVDEEDEKLAEVNRVAELIRQAEAAAQQTEKSEKRFAQALRSPRAKDSVVALGIDIDLDFETLAGACETYKQVTLPNQNGDRESHIDIDSISGSVEEKLSLTVSKSDFRDMRVVGQFNLGFILAVRRKEQSLAKTTAEAGDELFIIDQHASDEKFNFERLQAETVVGNQRMVRSVVLDLTAVEEEIVIDNTVALEKNGFVVDIDTSGEQPVGNRCRLVSLPLSREVVFGTKDLDELIHLLAESPMLNDSSPVPRPTKVRKMFAMRACRSSIMIGKTLSRKQMASVLEHMGTIDKPWNCPHGRPTMRHLASLDAFRDALWREGDGVFPGSESSSPSSGLALATWRSYTA